MNQKLSYALYGLGLAVLIKGLFRGSEGIAASLLFSLTLIGAGVFLQWSNDDKNNM